tara:strand:+ start:190 stop:360 length:171 start_codon:yes stop_codon:yes gene_type:complete
MTDIHKENGTEQLVGEKYQTNIIEFPLVIQMERILREATRLEKRTKELLKRAKSML